MKESRDDEHIFFIRNAVIIFSNTIVLIVINNSIKFKYNFKDVKFKCEQKINTNKIELFPSLSM